MQMFEGLKAGEQIDAAGSDALEIRSVLDPRMADRHIWLNGEQVKVRPHGAELMQELAGPGSKVQHRSPLRSQRRAKPQRMSIAGTMGQPRHGVWTVERLPSVGDFFLRHAT